MLLALVLCGLSVISARAEWKTERFDLVPGWNAIYLHVDPSFSKKTLDSLLEDTPVTKVWFWRPVISDAQFVRSIRETIAFESNWSSWSNNNQEGQGGLEYFIGNAAYLVYLDSTEDYTLALTGKVVPPSYSWTTTGENFIGFSTRSGIEPNFFTFFGLSDSLDSLGSDVYHYPGGEFGAPNPRLLDAPVITKVRRGEAFWIKDNDYNRFFGTFSLNLQDSRGIHFGRSLSTYRIRLENTSNKKITITMQVVPSEPPRDDSTIVAPPPLLLREKLDVKTGTFGSSDLMQGHIKRTLEPAGTNQASTEIILGVDRRKLSNEPGAIYAAILRFTDDVGGMKMMEVDVPVSAEVGSMAGLWVGDAVITQVQHDLVASELDSEGDTLLNEDGSASVSSTDKSFGGVGRGFPMRMILHMENDGTTRLLQRIYYGIDPASPEGLPTPILATKEGFLSPLHLDTARRITAVHLPWSEDNTPWPVQGELSFSGTISTSVTNLFNDHSSNPFLHTYHPDHDNKNPKFEDYGPEGRGQESFDIIRDIELSMGTSMQSNRQSAALASAEASSGRNNARTPDLPEGMAMTAVPQGSFVMGNEKASGENREDQRPEQVVYMSPFEMSEAEVTVGQYVDFLNAAYGEGLIEVKLESGGNYVRGAKGQQFEGLIFLELTGSRSDGGGSRENPLNKCWVSWDEISKVFSVKDPDSIQWESYPFEDNENLGDWRELNHWRAIQAQSEQPEVFVPAVTELISPLRVAEITPTELVDGKVDGLGGVFRLNAPQHVLVQNNIAYVANQGSDGTAGTAGLAIIDVSDARQPTVIRSISDTVDLNLDSAHHLSIDGDYLYLTAKQAVTVFSIPNLLSEMSDQEAIVATVKGDESNPINNPQATEIDGDYLYIVDMSGKLTVVNVQDPAEPTIEQQFTPGNSTQLFCIQIVNQLAFVAASSGDEHKVLILNVKNPKAWLRGGGPEILYEIKDGIGGFDDISGVNHLFVDEKKERLYISSETDNAVTIVDVAPFFGPKENPEPSQLSVFEDDELTGPGRMSLGDGLLLVPSLQTDKIHFVDVSNPERPQLQDVLELGDGDHEEIDPINNLGEEGGMTYDLIDGPGFIGLSEDQLFIAGSESNALTILNYPHRVESYHYPKKDEVRDWPATFISWYGAKSFAVYYGCDLPSEAQWEYSAKGGRNLNYATTDGSIDKTQANYNDSALSNKGYVEPVKSYAPNPFGLFDMSGNTSEWCRDWYDPDYYDRLESDYDPVNESLEQAAQEPNGNTEHVGEESQGFDGNTRVVRGGGWKFSNDQLQTTERNNYDPSVTSSDLGFRIVRESYKVAPLVAIDFNALSSGGETLSGTYRETIRLLGKPATKTKSEDLKSFGIAGEVRLRRISQIPDLKLK